MLAQLKTVVLVKKQNNWPLLSELSIWTISIGFIIISKWLKKTQFLTPGFKTTEHHSRSFENGVWSTTEKNLEKVQTELA